MIKFEFTKVWKKKYILLLIILAFLLAGQSLSVIKSKGGIFHLNEKQMYDREFYLNTLTQRLSDTINLSDEDFKNLSTLAVEKDINMMMLKSELYSDSMDESDIYKLRDITIEYGKEMENIIKDYKLSIPKDMQKAIEWNNFEDELMKKYNTALFTGPSSMHALSPFRILIGSSKTIFGVIPIIFFMILTIMMVSKEKLDGSLLLSKTMPVSREKVIFSKLFVILFLALLYSILAIVFSLVLSSISGYYWLNGHLDIYRVFKDSDAKRYYLAFELLIRIVIGFLIMILFFSSIALLISNRIKNYFTTIVILSSLLLIISVLTRTFESFRLFINPIYSLSFKDNILGFVNFSRGENFNQQSYVYSKDLIYYLNYFLLSIIITLVSTLNLHDSKATYKEKNYDSKSIFKFEYVKLIGNTAASSIIISIICVFSVLFFISFAEDLKLKDSYENSNSSADYFGSKLDNAKDNARLNQVDLDDENNDFVKDIRKYEKLYKDALNANKYISEKNGKDYYKLKMAEFLDDEYAGGEVLKDKHVTAFSNNESVALYNYLSDNNIKPYLLSDNFFLSSFETLVKDYYNYLEDNINSHSASYIPRRIERTYPVDLIVIVLISLLSLGAYSFDKENGNQIELLYTQPATRKKYHINKILASFLVGLLGLGIIFLLIFILGFITEGMGDIDFPVVEYLRDANLETIAIGEPYFKIIPIWKYNLRLIISYIFQIAFLASLGSLISIFVKEKIKVVGLSLGITGLIIYLQNLIKSPIKIISPFTHMNASKIANGSMIVRSSLKTNNIFISLIVLSAWTVLLLVVGIKIAEKREVK